MRLLALLTWLSVTMAAILTKFMPGSAMEDYQQNLKVLLEKVLWAAQVKNCFVIITDELHYAIYDSKYFEAISRYPLPYYVLRVEDNDDLLEPHNETQRLLGAVKAHDCDVHVITVLNGGQVKRLLQFTYESRSLNTLRKFVLLYDSRLFCEEMLHLWSSMVRSIFLRQHPGNSFSIYTIAYPGILSGVLVIKYLSHWDRGKRIDGELLFKDKTRNLNGAQLPVAIVEHVPMVQLVASTNSYQGIEVEILGALAKALNFLPAYYKIDESDTASLIPLENKTNIAKVIDEVANHNARLAIGDLHLFQSYLDHIELSFPHNFECLTFLTAESSTDSSWQTFILPFSGGMWIGVLLSLFVVGTIFYIISYFNATLMSTQDSKKSTSFFRCLRKHSASGKRFDERTLRSVSFRIALNRHNQVPLKKSFQLDLFDSYSNCLLLTYSMLLYVTLPRMPHNWPLRVLTGWYWIYCILLVATYRASFTAILANPAARVTIDTLQELVHAQIATASGAAENRQFFIDASDDMAQKVGAKMEIVQQNNDLISRIARGQCAYYDNEYYLRYLRVGGDNRSEVGSTALHIMRECAVIMPVVIGLEKNSPLKPHIDKYIMHLNEGGFISKWVKDAIKRLPAEEQAPQEALMNLHKFWSSFVALAVGYIISVCTIFIERWHFKHCVIKHPVYDVYNPSLYYSFKRLYPDM